MRQACAVCVLVVVAVSAARADTRLIDAAKAGDSQVVRTLLRQGVDVGTRESDGTTALHWAARGDHEAVVRALLAAGADANARNRSGMTPLVLAAINGSAVLIQALVDAGADPRTALPEGQTALMAAARTGTTAAVEVLLARGADANARERRLGETASMWAAAEDHAGAVEVLVRHGADVNARSNPASFPRFSFGDGIVALMMTLPRGQWTPLMYAARQGAVGATRALVAARANLDATDPQGTTPLMLAIENAHYDVASVLVESGADLNVADVTGMTALYAAVNMNTLGGLPGRPAPRPTGALGAVGLVRLLLARGADPNSRLTTPILQRHHSSGDAALGEGATAFLRAAKTGDIAMLRLLLEKGADAALTTKNQATAVMLAAGPASGGLGGVFPVSEVDKIQAMALAIEHGVDINAADVAGQTALHIAAGQAGPRVVQALLQRGARLDLEDKQGRTPLDVAMGVGGRGGAPVVRTEVAEILRGFVAPTATEPR